MTMSGLFGGGKAPPPPPVVRMPTPGDPTVLAAADRARAEAARRKGRLATILTEPLRSISGSKGLLGR
jgi:hypothetical protein